MKKNNTLSIGVIAESFRTGTLVEAFDKAACVGCTGVQIYAISSYLNMLTDPDEKLEELQNECKAHGLTIVSVCADLGGHGLSDVAGNAERIVKLTRIIERSDRFFGCRILTTHIGIVPRDPDSSAYRQMVQDMRTICDIAYDHNMKIAVETGPETALSLRRFLDDTASRGAGVNLDPANLAMVQNADAAESVRILAPYIIHTHAKDGVHYRDCDPEVVYNAFAEGGFEALVAQTGELFAEKPLGEGQVDWNAYIRALREIEYCGYLTIEREVGADPGKDIQAAVQFLKQKLA